MNLFMFVSYSFFVCVHAMSMALFSAQNKINVLPTVTQDTRPPAIIKLKIRFCQFCDCNLLNVLYFIYFSLWAVGIRASLNVKYLRPDLKESSNNQNVCMEIVKVTSINEIIYYLWCLMKSHFFLSPNEIDFFQGFNQFIFDDFDFYSSCCEWKTLTIVDCRFQIEKWFSEQITFFISIVKRWSHSKTMIGFCAVVMTHETDISMRMANGKDSGFHCCTFFIEMK